MKRVIVLGILILLVSSFVIAEYEGPKSYGGIGEEDVDEFNNLTEKIPINDEGKIDQEKVHGLISKAEERANEINGWLDENAYWLSPVFGMTPEVSWLFAFTLYWWLAWFVLFVWNAEIFLFFTYIITQDRVQSSQAKKYARIAGIAFFVILLVLKINLHVGRFTYYSWGLIWNYLLPWNLLLGIVAMVIAWVVLIALLIFAPQFVISIVRSFETRREAKAKERAEEDRENLHRLTRRALGR